MGGDARRRSVAAQGGPVAVSACLLGVPCRYDGTHRRSEAVLRAVRGRRVWPICPEVIAGFGVPRPPIVLTESPRRVVDAAGRDRTEALRAAGRWVVVQARRLGIAAAVLKERSPSCGVHALVRDGRTVAGTGLVAAMLRDAGVACTSDETLD